MRADWSLQDAKRFQRTERDLAGYVRNLIDRHDATDAEIHNLVQGIIGVVRSYPMPCWPGWKSDPRAQDLIRERDERLAASRSPEVTEPAQVAMEIES